MRKEDSKEISEYIKEFLNNGGVIIKLEDANCENPIVFDFKNPVIKDFYVCS